jgi:putative glycosyltransferase (TIGR04372 family)
MNFDHYLQKTKNFIYLTLKKNGLFLSNKNNLLIKIFFILLNFFVWILFYLGVRIYICSTSGRIGHLVCEPFYIELLKRNNLTKGKIFIVLSGNIANPYIKSLLPKYNIFIKNAFLITILKLLVFSDKIVVDTANAIGSHEAAPFFALLDEDLQTNPFLKIPPRSDSEVSNLLTNLGISPSDWYVCLHVRTDAYFTEDQKIHTYRNSNFDNYLPAVQFIKSMGGKVVKVGEPDEFSNEKESGVIHYENSIYRNAKNDVLINSHCSFFIGNTSGIQAVPGSLGIPIVAVNAAPLAACKIWGPQDIAIPKLYFNEKTKEIIGFKSVMNNPMGSFRYSAKFEEASVSLIENSPEEILWAVEEMYKKVFLKGQTSLQKTQLQLDFDSLFNDTHFTFYSKTLICAKFLEKYKDYIYK